MKHFSHLLLLPLFLGLGCGSAGTAVPKEEQRSPAGKTTPKKQASPDQPTGKSQSSVKKRQPSVKRKPRTIAQRLGTFWKDPPGNPFQLPQVVEIRVPETRHGSAIWGATGRDDRGHVWYGVAHWAGGKDPSAVLYRLDVSNGQSTLLGDVVGQLTKLGIRRPKENQLKIHSKIAQANDGRMYFASMDETGETADGLKYPKWGGHLWCLDPDTGKWEHLAKTKEALIALGCSGRWVYALGYFKHVLYQYDTVTKKIRSTTVGAAGGHISRNFLIDLNGHAYVPRVGKAPPVARKKGRRKKVELRAELVELDENLEEVGVTPLADYGFGANFDSHGITAFSHSPTGALFFVTHEGAFYKLTPSSSGPAKAERLGWFHPNGRAYTTSLHSFSGDRYVCGISKRRGKGYEWVVYDLELSRALAMEFPRANNNVFARKSLLLYGTNTRDNLGRSYVVGRYMRISDKRMRPIMIQIAPGQQD